MITIDILYNAYLEAKKTKRNKRNVINFELNLYQELEKLKNELNSNTYKLSSYNQFTIKEGEKQRVIEAPNFRDILVQHYLYHKYYTLLDNKMIEQSFSCRRGKGIYKAISYTKRYLQQSTSNSYYLQLDIKKFFYKINREILFKLLSKHITNKYDLELFKKFIFYNNEKIGIPLGNLLSQIFSNLYMTKLDNYIKRVLKIKHYLRYADDFILMNITKEQAWEYKFKIEQFLQKYLKLELSKFIIQKQSYGINFVGFRIWKTHYIVRKKTRKKFFKNIKNKKIISLISQLGFVKYSNSYKYFCRLLQKNALYHSLPFKIQKEFKKFKL